jgi:hypothetical protein
MIIGQIVDKMPSAHLRRADSRLLDSDTLLGVEIEVEGCTKKLPTNRAETGYWSMKEDHSLRDGGMEFVFAEPLFGADAVAAILFLCEQAKLHKWKISERTGIHVHMDVRNMEETKFQNFCILYALTERLLYNWVGDRRDTNIHCLPWYVADGDISQIGAIFRAPKEAVATIKNINRYSGLNLNSLLSFGTAEFRQLKTTFDSQRILDWINMILSLKHAAEAWQGTPDQLIKEMRLLGAFGFATRVFRDLVHKLWYPDFSKHFLGTSIPVAQQLIAYTKEAPSETVVKRMIAHTRNEADERGEHPGLAKFKAKFKKPANSKEKKIKTPFGEFTLDEWVQYTAPPPEPIVDTQATPWPNTLTPGNPNQLSADGIWANELQSLASSQDPEENL